MSLLGAIESLLSLRPVRIRRRVGRKPYGARGDGRFTQQIVGESYYQDVLEQMCGGRQEGGHDKRVAVRLVPEPTNPHDDNAVRIDIATMKVGYLSREDAIGHLSALRTAGIPGIAVHCFGKIVGGWEREDDDIGNFGVRLDIVYPLTIQEMDGE